MSHHILYSIIMFSSRFPTWKPSLQSKQVAHLSPKSVPHCRCGCGYLGCGWLAHGWWFVPRSFVKRAMEPKHHKKWCDLICRYADYVNLTWLDTWHTNFDHYFVIFFSIALHNFLGVVSSSLGPAPWTRQAAHGCQILNPSQNTLNFCFSISQPSRCHNSLQLIALCHLKHQDRTKGISGITPSSNKSCQMFIYINIYIYSEYMYTYHN